MDDKPRDPWEGTQLFPPSEPAEGLNLFAPANPRPDGQLEEHRAEIILTLAVISLFPIFGLLALVAVAMAWGDLKKMSQGTMDQSGRTQTIVGLSLGILELCIIAASTIYFAIRAVT
jgi:hypothetical protein